MFETRKGFDAALKLNGSQDKYEGRKLKIEIAKELPKAPNGKTKGALSKAGENKAKAQQKKKGDETVTAPDTDMNAVLSQKMIQNLINANQIADFVGLESIASKIVRRAQEAKAAKARRLEKQRVKEKSNFAVYITGLPSKNFDEEALKKRFSDCGSIKYQWLPTKSNGENKGKAVIAFKTEEALQKALGYNGTKCKDSKGTESVLTVRRQSSEKSADANGNSVEAVAGTPDTKEGKKAKRKAATIGEGGDDEADASSEKTKKPKNVEAGSVESDVKKSKKERKPVDTEEQVVPKKKKPKVEN